MNFKHLRAALLNQGPLLAIGVGYTASMFFWSHVGLNDVFVVTLCWLIAATWVGLRYQEIGHDERRLAREVETAKTQQVLDDSKRIREHAEQWNKRLGIASDDLDRAIDRNANA